MVGSQNESPPIAIQYSLPFIAFLPSGHTSVVQRVARLSRDKNRLPVYFNLSEMDPIRWFGECSRRSGSNRIQDTSEKSWLRLGPEFKPPSMSKPNSALQYQST